MKRLESGEIRAFGYQSLGIRVWGLEWGLWDLDKAHAKTFLASFARWVMSIIVTKHSPTPVPRVGECLVTIIEL